jgi:ABC-2 type transport system ATP-binding protein
MSIQVNKVSKLYGEQKALNNISFEIKTGEVVGFLGPNGAGKSTMMKIITGAIPATEGEVMVEGLDVMANPMQVKKMIGYLPENNPLYLDMYVKEYLNYVAQIYKIADAKNQLARIVEKTGLTQEQHKKIGALSKGYRQRVGLAQALIHDPKVLILDEPTSGLDPNQIVEIRNLISEIGKEKTVMLSTHIMQEVEAICDRIIILKQGNLVADNITSQIQDGLQTKKQVVLVEFSAAVTKEKLVAIPGVFDAVNARDLHWIIETTSEKDIRQDLFNFAVAQHIAVLSMQKKEKTLEEVFQELTKN